MKTCGKCGRKSDYFVAHGEPEVKLCIPCAKKFIKTEWEIALWQTNDRFDDCDFIECGSNRKDAIKKFKAQIAEHPNRGATLRKSNNKFDDVGEVDAAWIDESEYDYWPADAD